MRSFEMIWIRISDPRSLGSWCIKGTDESVTRVDSSVPLMHHDPSDLGSLMRIRITPKERTLYINSSDSSMNSSSLVSVSSDVPRISLRIHFVVSLKAVKTRLLVT